MHTSNVTTKPNHFQPTRTSIRTSPASTRTTPLTARTLAALAAAAFLPTLSACHVNVGAGNMHTDTTTTTTTAATGPAIPKADVEQITAQLIRGKSGGGPYVITCPNDLPITLGATMQCVLADQQGIHRELTITVSKADSPNNATWDWEVGKEISPN